MCNDISPECGNLTELTREHSLQVLDSTNADLLLDSGFKLSDIKVILCSKLLDYILLKSGSISGLYFTQVRD